MAKDKKEKQKLSTQQLIEKHLSAIKKLKEKEKKENEKALYLFNANMQKFFNKSLTSEDFDNFYNILVEYYNSQNLQLQ